jgi:D-proline reductase (dithiol) PrdB
MDDNPYGFASPDDKPIPYMERIRTYYTTLGYGKPYEWAHHSETPFTPLKKPVSESRVALITTAAPYQPGKGDQGPGSAYNAAAKFYDVYSGDTSVDHDTRISHIGIDRVHTSQEDSNTWFPLPMLRQLADEGVIGEVAPRFHGAPTNRSHRTTIEVDAAEIIRRVREDEADVAVIAAN